MRINTNVSALNAHRNMSVNATATERSIQKLSSGFRLNRAADDAAGMAIANKLRAEGRSLQQAQRNASQGTAMLQVMDGAIQTVSTILDRMKELATQANSDNVGDQRQKLQDEFDSLRSEIGRIADTTKYQGRALVNGTFGNSVNTSAATSTVLAAATGVTGAKISGAAAATYTFADTAGSIQVSATINGTAVTQTVTGAAANSSVVFDKVGITLQLGAGYVAGNADGDLVVTAGSGGGSFMVSSSGSYTTNDLISVESVNLTTGTSGLNLGGLDLLSGTNAQTSLARLDTAIDAVNTSIGKLGAAQSRFDFASSNVATTLQNVTAAESTIRDADMAYEMTQFTKNNILQQAAQSMLAQANQGPQGVLQLLRG